MMEMISFLTKVILKGQLTNNISIESLMLLIFDTSTSNTEPV